MRRLIEALVIGLVVWSMGCPSLERQRKYIWFEDFERAECKPPDCPLQRLGGSQESVFIAPIVAGDSGLVMRGDGVLVRVNIGVDVFASPLDVAFDVVARCDLNNALLIQVEIINQNNAFEIKTLQSLPILLSWNEPRPQAIRLSPSFNPGLFVHRLESMFISKTGEGQCEIAFVGVARLSVF
ncbi:MAG: hypothetical protein N2515_02100 [Deltaproteobacteria bacterium]|nr:hypothetical protein [Deltaproteobacteria bacterium]